MVSFRSSKQRKESEKLQSRQCVADFARTIFYSCNKKSRSTRMSMADSIPSQEAESEGKALPSLDIMQEKEIARREQGQAEQMAAAPEFSDAGAVTQQNCQYIDKFEPLTDSAQQTDADCSPSAQEEKLLCYKQFQQWLARANAISQQLAQENDTLKTKVKSLLAQLENAQRSDNQGHDLVKEFIEREKANQLLVDQLQQKINQLQQQTVSSTTSDSNIKLKYEEKLKAKDVEMQALEKQILALQKQKADADQKLQEQRVFVQRLNKSQKEMQKSAEENEQRVRTAEQLYQTSQEKILSLQHLTQKFDQQQLQLQGTVTTLRQQLAEVQNTKKTEAKSPESTQDQNIQKLLTDNRKLLVEVAQLKQQQSDLADQNRLLQEQNFVYRKSNESLAESLAQQNDSVIQLQGQLNDKLSGEHGVMKMASESAALQQQNEIELNKLRDQVISGKQQIQALNKKIISYQQEVEQQQQQINDMNSVKESWLQQVESYQTNEVKQFDDRENLKQTIAELQQQLNAQQTQEKFYSESKIKQLSELRQNIELQNKQLHAQNHDLEQHVRRLQADNEQLSQKLRRQDIQLQVRSKKLEVSSVQQFSELRSSQQYRTQPKPGLSDVDQALKAKQQLQKAQIQIQYLHSQLELSDKQRTLDHQQYSTEIDQKNAEIDELNAQLSQYYKQHYGELQDQLAANKAAQELGRQVLALQHQLEKIDWYRRAKQLEELLQEERCKCEQAQYLNQLLRQQYEQKQLEQEAKIEQLKTDYNLVRIRLNTMSPKGEESYIQKLQDQRLTVGELIRINERQLRQIDALNKTVEELRAKCNKPALKQPTFQTPQTSRKSTDFSQIISGDKYKLFNTVAEFLLDLSRECQQSELLYTQSRFDVSAVSQMIESLDTQLLLQKQPKLDDAIVKKGVQALRQCFMLDKYEKGVQAKRIVSRIPQIVLEAEQMVVVTAGNV